jgi:hypothetical protein
MHEDYRPAPVFMILRGAGNPGPCHAGQASAPRELPAETRDQFAVSTKPKEKSKTASWEVTVASNKNSWIEKVFVVLEGMDPITHPTRCGCAKSAHQGQPGVTADGEVQAVSRLETIPDPEFDRSCY